MVVPHSNTKNAAVVLYRGFHKFVRLDKRKIFLFLEIMTKCTRVKYALYKEKMEDGKLTYEEIGRFCNIKDMSAIVGCEYTQLWKIMEGKIKPLKKGKGFKAVRIWTN